MSYLIFDTETTGFPRKELPANHPDQARIIQLAALLLDENFKERACFHTLIKPAGWKISEGAQVVHGISLEDCDAFGMDIAHAVGVFKRFADFAKIGIAHNLKFDKQMLELEGVDHFPFPFCTMDAMTDICKLPSKRGGYKWPKLKEACQHAFGEDIQFQEHDALADCRACAKLFRWLKEREVGEVQCIANTG